MSRRIIGYARVAPREREAERPGLDAQRRQLAAACAERGWTLVRTEEDVRSGRSMRRRGLRAALDACRTGEADAVAVARLDRLTYSLRDLADLVRAATEEGFALVSLDPELDLASDSGRVVGDVLATAARWTPSIVAEPAAARGLIGGHRVGRPSSIPPALAARIRGLRAEGRTLQGICDLLNAERVPTPRGGAEWRPTSLRAILRADEPG
ncbi:MAG: recombinase family protein [Actinomycetota bacterium]